VKTVTTYSAITPANAPMMGGAGYAPAYDYSYGSGYVLTFNKLG